MDAQAHDGVWELVERPAPLHFSRLGGMYIIYTSVTVKVCVAEDGVLFVCFIA